MSTATSFAPLAAADRAPIQLAMQRLWLTGQVLPVGARLAVQHVFRSAEERPVEVIYSFPLPRDAALRAFRISGDGFDVHSQLKPAEEAVKLYEQGIAAGSLAAMARAYGDGLVNLTVGNIRPAETVTVRLELLAGVEARDDGYRFRFPFTLAPSYHAKMKVAVVDGAGEIELPPEFGDVILPSFRHDTGSLHEVGFDLALGGAATEEIASPSHAIRVRTGGQTPRVLLAPERDVPDRDLVLDVRYAAEPLVLAGQASDGRKHFAAVVPSTVFGAASDGPRRVAIVVDRSGSMEGAPMAQAKKAIEACLAALGESDEFGIVAFDDCVEALSNRLLKGTRESRDRARTFLAGVEARGSTELVAGFAAAAKLLTGGGEVMVLTDGQVFGTEQILARARAAGIRISCLGIGSASQDRFLALLARETGGISRFVTPRERVDMAAVDLFASLGRPVASKLVTPEGVRPELPGVVFPGTPVSIFGVGEGPLALAWDGGRTEVAIPSGDGATDETVRLLQGARLITDAESRQAEGLRALSEEFGLASRAMSLVAVVRRAGDRPGELPTTQVVPLGMAQDVEFEGYFSQGMIAPAPAAAAPLASMMTMMACGDEAAPAPHKRRFARAMSKQAPAKEGASDDLFDLAASIEPDGGMPGKDLSSRVRKTIAAILAFVREGHTVSSGAFRSHVGRLVKFLSTTGGLSAQERALADQAVAAASSGDWKALDAAMAQK